MSGINFVRAAGLFSLKVGVRRSFSTENAVEVSSIALGYTEKNRNIAKCIFKKLHLLFLENSDHLSFLH